MWGIQEREGHFEVGTDQRPNPWKEEEEEKEGEDDDDAAAADDDDK